MKKHLLLISVSAGAGHVQAAEALRTSAAQLYPDVRVTHIDMMDYVTKAMKTVVIDSYDLMVKQLPELWGFIYKSSDQAKRHKQFEQLTGLVNRMNATRLYKAVATLKPDTILCTHYLPANALMKTPQKYRQETPVSLLMTDYDKLNLMFHPGFFFYFVATERIKWKMMHVGVEQNRIIVSGIPIDPQFYAPKKKTQLRLSYDLPEQQKTLLLLSGGNGLKQIDHTVTKLMCRSEPLTIIAIAGKNKKLLEKLKRLKPPANILLRPIGWTNTMDEYMRMADIVISKPGGMTTTECLVLGKPLLAVEPIPGQEEANAEYILSTGLGAVARSDEDVLYYLSQPTDSWYAPKPMPPHRAAQVILESLLKK